MDRDTSLEARRRRREVLQDLGGVGRLVCAFEMCDDARSLSASGIRAREPEVSPEQAHERVVRRLLGAELFDAAYRSRAD